MHLKIEPVGQDIVEDSKHMDWIMPWAKDLESHTYWRDFHCYSKADGGCYWVHLMHVSLMNSGSNIGCARVALGMVSWSNRLNRSLLIPFLNSATGIQSYWKVSWVIQTLDCPRIDCFAVGLKFAYCTVSIPLSSVFACLFNAGSTHFPAFIFLSAIYLCSTCP